VRPSIDVRYLLFQKKFFLKKKKKQIKEVGKRFRVGVRLITLRLRFKTYFNCFSGFFFFRPLLSFLLFESKMLFIYLFIFIYSLFLF